ncbi:MAG: alkaline phosphatase [Victivallales bacterium]
MKILHVQKMIVMLLGLFPILLFAEQSPEPPLKAVRYVFLFIGDGMGKAHRAAAEAYALKTTGKGLAINAMPHQAEMTTFAANNPVTDSAASGTAIASGTKTNVWYIGMSPDGKPLDSIAVSAKRAGKKVAILSSKNLNDATPAAFYAHSRSRSNLYEIGLELIHSDFDFWGGGGILDFDDKKAPSYQGNLYEMAKRRGFKVVSNPKEIMALKPCREKIIVGVEGGRMPYAMQNKSLKLADYVAKAIELLQEHEKGFFLMCEGGKIDWAAHANDAALMLTEMLDFDLAYRTALAFAEKHPDNTLIVVTADHETGGLSFGKAASGYSVNYDLLFRKYAPRGTFAMKFIKLKSNDRPYSFEDLKKDLAALYGFDFSGRGPLGLSPEEIDRLEKDFNRHFVHGRNNGDYYMLDTLLLRLYNKKAGFQWTTNGHTGQPVLTSAYGVNAEMFSSPMDNTDIGKRLKQAVR